jgi:hypothetical protein
LPSLFRQSLADIELIQIRSWWSSYDLTDFLYQRE